MSLLVNRGLSVFLIKRLSDELKAEGRDGWNGGVQTPELWSQ